MEKTEAQFPSMTLALLEVAGQLAAAIGRRQAMRRRRTELDELLAFEPARLDDIGLDRFDIEIARVSGLQLRQRY